MVGSRTLKPDPHARERQPALAMYLRDPHAPIARAHAIMVLTLDGNGISHITRFGQASLFDRFGLPRNLDV